MSDDKASLSVLLRERTEDLHRTVERSDFMSALARGRLTRTAYVDWLWQLLAIYRVLERVLSAPNSEASWAPLPMGGLARSRAIEDDLREFTGLPVTDSPEAGPAKGTLQTAACKRYCERLEFLAENWPTGLLAHVYVRYLGDLGGGQVLKRVIARAYELGDSSGTSVYDFGGPDRVAEYRRAIRDALDDCAEPDEAMVEEARSAFRMHQSLFDELAQRHR